ncbi:porin family protein [Aurantiacibacter xanthus]|uniref:Porin family protein n=1 Tax=Aurantiacibacter xanthus TaxID=1784712 RepID=A0A3A1P2S4_9SPHN|nr:outer membrane beta-barrel protein [Aurantiacibacter xanthus]RIV84448.1 porin family protein [Aurantiacibacter xanthus]
MKSIAFFAAAAATLIATPAFAQGTAASFTGPRVGVEIGVADDDFLGTEETTYGFNAGYDFDLGKVVLGATVNYTDVFDGDDIDFRELGVGARAGVKVDPSALLYATVGYSDISVSNLSVDGVKLGLGGEVALGQHLYANLETRYASYDFDIDVYQTVIGVGYRF